MRVVLSLPSPPGCGLRLHRLGLPYASRLVQISRHPKTINCMELPVTRKYKQQKVRQHGFDCRYVL